MYFQELANYAILPRQNWRAAFFGTGIPGRSRINNEGSSNQIAQGMCAIPGCEEVSLIVCIRDCWYPTTYSRIGVHLPETLKACKLAIQSYLRRLGISLP
jgi:hypothetical protein